VGNEKSDLSWNLTGGTRTQGQTGNVNRFLSIWVIYRLRFFVVVPCLDRIGVLAVRSRLIKALTKFSNADTKNHPPKHPTWLLPLAYSLSWYFHHCGRFSKSQRLDSKNIVG